MSTAAEMLQPTNDLMLQSVSLRNINRTTRVHMNITRNTKSTENGTAQELCAQRHNHQLVAGREGEHVVSERRR